MRTRVAINDVADAATLAQLLARDSIYGRFPGTITARDGGISIDGVEIAALAGMVLVPVPAGG